MARAMFAAGCFWSVESAFRRVRGLIDTRVGFSGGDVENPSYEHVATGKTGHVQVVSIDYDPLQIAYGDLLEVFWRIHDPTQPRPESPTVGSHCRSVIFYFDDQQRRTAEASKQLQQASGTYNKPILTEIVPAGRFYAAEEAHQRYYEIRGLMARSLLGRPFIKD